MKGGPGMTSAPFGASRRSFHPPHPFAELIPLTGGGGEGRGEGVIKQRRREAAAGQVFFLSTWALSISVCLRRVSPLPSFAHHVFVSSSVCLAAAGA